MRFGSLAPALALASACAPSVGIEVSVPPDIDRAALTGLRVLALPEGSTALAALRGEGGALGCDAFSALRARRGRTAVDDLADTLRFPLVEGEERLEVPDRVEAQDKLFVHVVALAEALRVTGEVDISSDTPIALSPVAAAPIAEGCACVQLGGPDSSGDCLDGTDGPIAVPLGPILPEGDVVEVLARGPTEVTVVRGMRALIAPAVRVDVRGCEGARDSPACLSCSGGCRHPDLPVAVSIAGDPTVTLPTAVLLTNPDGDVVVPVDVGACPTGSFEVTLGLVGHGPAVRLQGTCVDDAPVARAPVVVAEGLRGQVELVRVGRQLVAMSEGTRGEAVLQVIGAGAPPAVRSSTVIVGERPAGAVAYGADGLVVATVDTALSIHLRRFVITEGGALRQEAETSGLCGDAGCALASNACTSPLVCAEPVNAPTASLDVADVDGDGVAEISLVRKDVGLTVYDGDLSSCRRITALAPTAGRHVLARFAGDVRVPSVVAVDGSGLALRPPEARSRAGRPCDPAAPTCAAGQVCHVSCADGIPCAGITTKVGAGTCITPCAAMDAACGQGGTCARVPGDAFACLEPGLACGQGTEGSAVGVLVGFVGELRRGTLRARAGGREDLVMMDRDGAASVVFGAEAPLAIGNNDERRTTLFPRPEAGAAPRGARVTAVGDVNGDGVDDLAVGFQGEVRTWLGGVGVPGEASAIALPECDPVALAIVDASGSGRGGVMVACAVSGRRGSDDSIAVRWAPR